MFKRTKNMISSFYDYELQQRMRTKERNEKTNQIKRAMQELRAERDYWPVNINWILTSQKLKANNAHFENMGASI